MRVTPTAYLEFVNGYLYHRNQTETSNGQSTTYRLSSNYWLRCDGVQEVYDWRAGQWVSTDNLVYRLIHGDIDLERLDYDPTVVTPGQSGGLEGSLVDMVELLISQSENVGGRMEKKFAFSDVEESLPWVLDEVRKTARRWVVLLETISEPSKYVQVLITASGSMWAECVSNAFLEGDDRLDDAQCELLPTLGWEWPGPPAFPNWHFHDELLNTSSAVAGLVVRTMRQVLGVKGDEAVRVIVLSLAAKEEPVEQR